MIGVIAAGGKGVRLRPLTSGVNKHMLPMGDRPMVLHAVDRLVEAGVKDAVLVTTPEDVLSFRRLLGDGKQHGLNWLMYGVQERPGGVAHALKVGLLAASVADRLETIALILADNLFAVSLAPMVRHFHRGARCLLAIGTSEEVMRASGVARRDGHGHVVSVVEKPQPPYAAWDAAVAGFYLFDETVSWRLGTIKPSARGELEITDLLYSYVQMNDLTYDEIPASLWLDAGGSIEGYYQAVLSVRSGANFGSFPFPLSEEGSQ